MSTRNYDTLVLTVGKHKYDTFAYVYENDGSYCDWILDRKEFENESLNAFRDYILLRDYCENENENDNQNYSCCAQWLDIIRNILDALLR